jgi:hypothetical protein
MKIDKRRGEMAMGQREKIYKNLSGRRAASLAIPNFSSHIILDILPSFWKAFCL